MESVKKSRVLGVSGTVIGLLALVATVLHFYLGPIKKPEPIESFIAEKTVNIRDAIAARVKGEEYAPPERPTAVDPDLILSRVTMVAALLALSFGVVGLLRREEYLPSGMALGLGSATVVFSMSIALAGVIVAAILLGAIIISLGLDIGI